ncbi:DEAD/DEAH box helicase [Acidiphilium rubrum]|uniref:DEAD/DEAH box helicase n=1 Tax=Acidiphilium rubrum TaxID=526 RepID=UPI002D1F9FE5|nr:DEAD/DEAH box helicase [Acidiphilium rubrum]
MGATAIVRFGGTVEQVLASEIVEVPSLHSALRNGSLSDPTDAVIRAQALAIGSVNDQWGVFSRSRVQLLPHQLWVCRKVNQEWPFRWLVADDVGLGKTIECGLVLMPLIASGRVRRVLILAPAKLVPQWQFRLKDMFDIRLQRYVTEADTLRGDFWATASMVVASFHTLRDDRRGARQRLLEADPWDLVIVDEAHHLGVDERAGETLAYSLVSDLEERSKINSLLFFTGTPHRGKDYGFFGLMHLVRPDVFDPDGDKIAQLSQLPKVMIRNNKAAVTDLQGVRLFRPVNVFSREYGYSDKETLFYRTLSEFILDGRAYAATLDGRAQTARMLVLITLQKLAASSIAAIRNALRKRRIMMADAVSRSNGAASVVLPDDEQATFDDMAEAEEALPSSAAVLLMGDEIQRIDELISLSEGIGNETKIERLLQMIREEFGADEPVLLFTEYKATQALVVNALHRQFGFGSATFINGDERLDGLEQASGATKTISQPREHAADAFNAGKVRFLVSTEAGGEGIDLQERCAVLVHVDMPWNPMRLHQRVGRLSRYGQKRPVSVYILRNPQTVEARIWDLLNEKLERIQQALSSVMEEQEDISQLVIGMAGNSLFNELFSGGQGLSNERLGAWFDQTTATLGGRDVVETVRELLGNVSKFDFQQVGKDLPKVDLSDLEKFFTQTVSRHGRRIFRRDEGLEIKTPDEWKARSYALRDKYEGLVFDRNLRGTNAASRVLGVGHLLFDIALEEARNLPSTFARVDGLAAPLLVVTVEDQITGTGALVHRLIFGVTEKEGEAEVLRDWELLQLLNGIALRNAGKTAETDPSVVEQSSVVARLKQAFDAELGARAPTLRRPVSWPEILLLPVGQG